MDRKKIKSLLLGLGGVLLIAAVFAGTIYLARSRPANSTFVNKYATSDVVYADGSSAHFENKNFGTVNRGDVVTVALRLPAEKLVDDPVLAFYIYHAVTEIRCNGQLIDAYGADIAARGDLVGNHRFLTPLPDDAWGGEVTLTFHVTEDGAFNRVKNLRLYEAAHAYEFYIDADFIGFYVCTPLFFFGLAALLVLLLNGKFNSTTRKAAYIALFALLASSWIMTSKGVQNLYGWTGYGWTLLEFIAVFTMVIPVLLYAMETEHKPGARRALGCAAALTSLYFLVCTALNFTNILHYSATLLISNIITFADGLLLLYYAIRRRAKGGRADKIFLNGMLIMFCSGLFDLLRLNGFKYLPVLAKISLPSVLPIGVTFFLLFMIRSYATELMAQQKKLARAEVRTNDLQHMIASIPAGICVFRLDEQLTILEANEVFYGIFGHTRETALAEGFTDLRTPLDQTSQEKLRVQDGRLLSAGPSVEETELNIITRNGETRTILAKYHYEGSDSRRITTNIIDITDRKRMEEELRVSEEDYRTAIQASDHFYFNFDAATKTCTHMFDSEKLFGVSEKVDNIPESLIELGLCAPESIEDYREAFRLFAAGVPGGNLCLHLQNIRTHELRWYGGSWRTIFDAAGSPLHAIVAFKDITEQREKEIAYNIHKQQIQAHSEEEITYYELNLTTGRCDYHYGLEAERILAGSSCRWDEIIDRAQDFVHPEDWPAISSLLRCENLLSLYKHGVTVADREFRWEKADGETSWQRVSVSITSDALTREVRAYCTVENIDEEKKAQLEQERSSFYVDAYEKLSSSVMYGVCKYSAGDDLSIIFANDIFYQMHGYASHDEAVAAGFTSVLSAIPPFGKDMVRTVHREYTEGKAGQLFETEYPFIDAQGQRIWILCRGVYSPEEGMFNSSVLNITDRKKVEEELRVSEERYKLALEQSGKVFFFFDVPSRTMRLSQELADAFGLPLTVDNMPDNFISQGLVEPDSVAVYRAFYERIIAGEQSGEAVISCHMRQAPEQTLWYKIAFTSIFGADRQPTSAIITYEDMTGQYRADLASRWKQLNLLNLPERSYVVAEYDLTLGVILSQTGGLFAEMPDFMRGYEEINQLVLSNFVYDEDVAAYGEFLRRERLLELYSRGVSEDSIEYRSMQTGSSYRWTYTAVQMITDPYTGHTLGQLFFQDIHEQKSGQIEMKQNMEELQKELDNSRIKVMINQMQPHFLYNALSAIQTIVKTDPDYAYQLIFDFTTHLRSSIKALSSDAPIPFKDELKNIKAYLNIERMRFGDDLKVNYEIDCDEFSVIPLSIQPLAENAARHGVYPKGEDGGTVTVRTYETTAAYVVEVEDDGVGFDVSAILNRSGDSVGLKSLIFRLKSLMDAEVIIQSEPGRGTKATVKIPKERGRLL